MKDEGSVSCMNSKSSCKSSPRTADAWWIGPSLVRVERPWLSCLRIFTISLNRGPCIVCFLKPIKPSHQRPERTHVDSHWSLALWVILLSISGNPPATSPLFPLCLLRRQEAGRMDRCRVSAADLPIRMVIRMGKRIRYGQIMWSFQQPQWDFHKPLNWTIDAIDAVIIWR